MEQASSIEATLRRVWDFLQSTRAPEMAPADVALVHKYIAFISRGSLPYEIGGFVRRQRGKDGPHRLLFSSGIEAGNQPPEPTPLPIDATPVGIVAHQPIKDAAGAPAAQRHQSLHPIGDERSFVQPDPIRHYTLISRRETPGDQTGDWPDPKHRRAQRIDPIAVVQCGFHSCIVPRIAALADPHHHRQAGGLRAQIRHQKEIAVDLHGTGRPAKPSRAPLEHQQPPCGPNTWSQYHDRIFEIVANKPCCNCRRHCGRHCEFGRYFVRAITPTRLYREKRTA
jgi:hypothetical protein